MWHQDITSGFSPKQAVMVALFSPWCSTWVRRSSWSMLVTALAGDYCLVKPSEIVEICKALMNYNSIGLLSSFYPFTQTHEEIEWVSSEFVNTSQKRTGKLRLWALEVQASTCSKNEAPSRLVQIANKQYTDFIPCRKLANIFKQICSRKAICSVTYTGWRKLTLSD